MTGMLSGPAVRARVSMADAVAAVRAAFRSLDDFALPPRLVLGDGRVLVMAAHHGPSGTAVVKTLSVELGRTPAILGTVVRTGPDGQLVADAAAVTTLRTGAIVGVATDALADPHASALTVIGAGAQAADQVRGVHAVRPLTSLTVFARAADRAEALLAGLADELPGVRTRVATSIPDALSDAEVVCCATSATTPLFAAADLPEHVHVNAIGSFRLSMRELPEDLLATAGLVVVDQRAAAEEEAGEIVHALGTGALAPDRVLDLAAVLDRRQAAPGRTVFKTVGLAVQDWAVARLLG